MKTPKNVNQPQGPRSGNAGNADKRAAFFDEKGARTSRFQQLADMVTGALGRRGRDGLGETRPAVEGLAPDVNVGRRRSRRS